MSIKRLLMFAACVALGGPLMVRADTISMLDVDDSGGYSTGDTVGYMTCTRTAVSGTSWDKLVFKVSSLLGVNAGQSCVAIDGTFSAVGFYGAQAELSVGTGSKTGDWISETMGAHGAANTSYVALSLDLESFGSSSDAGTDPSSGLYYTGCNTDPNSGLPIYSTGVLTYSRTGTWNTATQQWTSTSSDNLFGSWFTLFGGIGAGGTFATMYVTSGQGVNFTGEFGAGSDPTVSFTETPEPGTFALLAAGLIGILACARPKRKLV